MIKVILMVIMAVFFSVAVLVIWYWRDAAYAPDSLDLIRYFILIPVGLSLLLLSPYVLMQWYQQRKENQAKATTVEPTVILPSDEMAYKTEWLHLQLFSAGAQSALGENENLLDALNLLQGPVLDSTLVNGLGNPILSYRITDLDRRVEVDWSEVAALQQRIYLLVQQQLEQHIETLYCVAQQLKKSACFYETPSAYQYRLHPAWVNPVAADALVEEESVIVEAVARLDALNIHLLLSEHLLHRWEEIESTARIQAYLQTLGIFEEQTQFHYHYFSKQHSYLDWMAQLQLIEQQQYQISLVVLADSEIDQASIDEKIWLTPNYIPAEFASSCCIAGLGIQIENLEQIKSIDIVLQEEQLTSSLETLKITELEQYAADQAFVLILDHPAAIKTVKTLTQRFTQTPIEPQHYIYSTPSLGHTDQLASIFGFMLALHIKDPNYGMVYSAEQPKTNVFITPKHIKTDRNHGLKR